MRVHFWGVRGSIAAPGPDTFRYGGNTSCVEVTLKDGTTIVLDGGTGLRPLGLDMLRRRRRWPIHMLISHHHWDHIQGFPFFLPIYDPKSELIIYPFRENEREELFSLLDQMDGAHFPVPHGEVPASVRIEEPKADEMRIGSAVVRRTATNHPGGGWAFRIEDDGHRVVYMTDNELDPPKQAVPVSGLVEFCRGADLLIHDSQYTPEELVGKKGWGHSSTAQAIDFAKAAGVSCLAMFHHDPQRTDEELDKFAAAAAESMGRHRKGSTAVAASEGLVIEVNSAGVRSTAPDRLLKV
jgi:phosphoribosyl 1,2-cyclic phosphodiesterase